MSGGRVGVVVPTRNAAAHVEHALASVLGQHPAPVDVVVVDGGSTDGTRDLVAALPGVRVVHQTGTGLGAARNQGIAEVDGDLVAFCDADDRWAAGALTVRVEHLARHPSCAAVIGSVVMEALDGDDVPVAQSARLGVALPGWTPGALLVRRDALERVGPFSDVLRIGTDSEWFVRLVESGLRVDVLPTVVLRKGARTASLSTDVGGYRAELLAVARAYIGRRRRDGGDVTGRAG